MSKCFCYFMIEKFIKVVKFYYVFLDKICKGIVRIEVVCKCVGDIDNLLIVYKIK